MMAKFNSAAAGRFGSGWAWLGVAEDGNLTITDTPNQDNPLQKGIVSETHIPILGLDVWEHVRCTPHAYPKADRALIVTV